MSILRVDQLSMRLIPRHLRFKEILKIFLQYQLSNLLRIFYVIFGNKINFFLNFLQFLLGQRKYSAECQAELTKFMSDEMSATV